MFSGAGIDLQTDKFVLNFNKQRVEKSVSLDSCGKLWSNITFQKCIKINRH